MENMGPERSSLPPLGLWLGGVGIIVVLLALPLPYPPWAERTIPQAPERGTILRNLIEAEGSLAPSKAVPGRRLPTAGPPSAGIQITLSERGLPAGATWGASWTSNFSSVADAGTEAPENLTTSLQNGTFLFEFTAAAGYLPQPTALVVNVSGFPVVLNVTYTPGVQVNFTLGFFEYGLPNGTPWGVTVSPGGAHRSARVDVGYGDLLCFVLPNGTYDVAPDLVPGFAAVGGWDNPIAIRGSGEFVNATFVPGYPVTFAEGGLPSGDNWSVTLNGSTVTTANRTIEFEEANGSDYTYWISTYAPYTATPLDGSFNVSGTPILFNITFGPSRSVEVYAVWVNETGLPSNTWWVLTLAGRTYATEGRSVQDALPNGSYPYSVAPVAGYDCDNCSGNLSIEGRSLAQRVDFFPAPAFDYALDFVEVGLPPRTAWSVSVDQSDHTSDNSTIVVRLPNGSYPFEIGGVSGYSVHTSSDSIRISGAMVEEHIDFSENATGSGFLGVSPPIVGYLALAGIIALVSAVAITVVRRRPRPPPPD